ncbi:hypothetical protein ACVIEM_005773 [Rhizobium leguminosarum]
MPKQGYCCDEGRMSDTDKPVLTSAPQMYVHYREEKECKE